MGNAKTLLGVVLALAVGPAVADRPATPLAWMAGHWCSEEDGRRIDEVWLPEAGGMLLGMARTMRGTQVQSFEFMRIVSDGRSVSFHAQPNGAPPTEFTMVASGEGRIRFANPAHDFPNQVEYRREGDRLGAWIAGPGPDGAQMRIAFEYRACGG
jgi:hypothetical protein